MASSVFIGLRGRQVILDRDPVSIQISAMSAERLVAPTLAEFEAMADAALAALPETFAARLGRLVVRVADFPPDALLAEMGIRDPYELTGLYDGIALTEQSSMDLPGPPPVVWLYRRPILDEWADRSGVELGRLVTHVLVHEIAHHFGFTDDDIAAIDEWWT